MIDNALTAFARQQLGPFTVLADLSWDHGESAVWHLQGESGEAVLKSHRQKRKFTQELHANLQWLPRLAGALNSPELLAFQEQALLFRFVPGSLVQDLPLTPDAERALHEQAGRALAALHRLEHSDTDQLPLSDAFGQRLEAWIIRARGIVPGQVTDRVRSAALEAVPMLAGQSRVPCHRDYTPRNWLADEQQELYIIDFEHARPDLYLNDFERLATGLWRSRPDLQDAFLAGYGRTLSADELALLRRTAALGALSTVVWAREHADRQFEEHGWDVLEWLGLAE